MCSRGGNKEEGAEQEGTKKGALTVEPTAKRRGVGVRQCIAGNRQTPSYRLYLKAMHSSAEHFSVPKRAPNTAFCSLDQPSLSTRAVYCVYASPYVLSFPCMSSKSNMDTYSVVDYIPLF